ncbi:ThuA domain-containing protein [Negadavirga shengliensis]|uniref:ThuA domain-containing protein n=1 Tax=Negadavirga shengliensis TaxID=1389218 RepID=A0ABV9SYX7_9BACT
MKYKLNVFLTLFLMTLHLGNLLLAAEDENELKGMKVLVYTKNGEGYVHDNIPHAVESIKRLGNQYGFQVEVTDDPGYFTKENLQDIDLMVFTSTNNDVFESDQQRLEFRKYIQAGGGIVGIHSVVGTERNWEWFKMLIGGRFVWHPKFQKFKINKIDHQHTSVKEMPSVWEKEDECYLMKELYPGIKVVMAHDLASLDKDQEERILELSAPFHRYYPAVWYQDFDGGFAWVTALGHHIKDYEDPTFVNHIYQGMKYIAGKVNGRNYSKAYASDRDTPVRFE